MSVGNNRGYESFIHGIWSVFAGIWLISEAYDATRDPRHDFRMNVMNSSAIATNVHFDVSVCMTICMHRWLTTVNSLWICRNYITELFVRMIVQFRFDQLITIYTHNLAICWRRMIYMVVRISQHTHTSTTLADVKIAWTHENACSAYNMITYNSRHACTNTNTDIKKHDVLI